MKLLCRLVGSKPYESNANDVCMLSDAGSSDSYPNDDSDTVTDDRLSPGERDDEQDLPVYLWRPGQTTDVIGQWEQHTRVSNTHIALQSCAGLLCRGSYLRNDSTVDH